MIKKMILIIISVFLLLGCDNDDVRAIPDEMAITTNSETFEFAGLAWGMLPEEVSKIRNIKDYKKQLTLTLKPVQISGAGQQVDITESNI